MADDARQLKQKSVDDHAAFAVISGGSKKRKSRPGRAARRRNRKVRAIQEAEAALFGKKADAATLARLVNDGEDGVAEGGQNGSVLPTDRTQSLPGVMERRYEYLVSTHTARTYTGAKATTVPDQPIECVDSNSAQRQISIDQLQDGDERLLTSQLGFIPGNAVHVAARVSDCPQLKLLESFGTNRDSTKDEDNKIEDAPSAPTVLKLYPLAIRNASPKRKYKSRQRGHISSSASTCPDDNDSSERKNDGRTDGNAGGSEMKKLQKKDARDWYVDSDDGIIEPFPTMYWLTDPRLRMLVSKLEISDNNNVKTMEAKVRSNPSYLASMERAHRHYGQSRWDMLTEGDQKTVTERGWDCAVGPDRGVAGIRDARGVKCLHAHAAHYLAGGTDNIVGKWTIEAVGDMLRENM